MRQQQHCYTGVIIFHQQKYRENGSCNSICIHLEDLFVWVWEFHFLWHQKKYQKYEVPFKLANKKLLEPISNAPMEYFYVFVALHTIN